MLQPRKLLKHQYLLFRAKRSSGIACGDARLICQYESECFEVFPQAGYDKGYQLTIVPNATHTQAIVCQNANAVDFIQAKMSAGTGIVLTDAQKDASQSPHCTGKF